jgi:uncharacterized membrane protein
MPNIGVFHPQIVHFVVGLLIIGVAARVLSLLQIRRLAFLSPMAATLIVLGTLAAFAAYKSGMQAHGPVERIPGAREAVQEHEEWGERTRNTFIFIAVFELAALALASRPRIRKTLLVLSALGGIAGLWVLYETAEHGGEVVYGHAGGVGTRTGDSTDVKHLLVAGLYQNIQTSRRAGDKDQAARLSDELARQMPDDADVRMMTIESRLRDRDDARGALAELVSMPVRDDDRRTQMRRASLMVQAYRSLGAMDSATAVIDDLKRRYPNDPRMTEMIQRLTSGAGGPGGPR